MAELVKPWNDGGSLSATYNGSGDGSAVFSSDEYEGIDRVTTVTFKDVSNTVQVERTVRQEGIRQQFATADGKVFCISGGGRFGVLKVGGVEPEPPVIETYTPLAYIQSTGAQHLELDYILKATDEVEVLYQATNQESRDQFLFGTYNSWVSTYNLIAYTRFGHSSSTSVSNGIYKCKVRLSQGKAVWDGGQVTTSLTYTELQETKVNVFAGRSSDGDAYNRGAFRIYYFRIYNGDGELVVDLMPAKRDNDGSIGVLDLVSSKFYGNVDTEDDLIAGGEMQIGDDYERIDQVVFNNDKIFDTGVFGNEKTYISVLFQRTDTSGADYLLGCSSGNRLTAYLTTSGYWRYGTAYPTFNIANKSIFTAEITPTKTTVSNSSKSFTTSAFTTAFTIPLGGHKPSSGTPTATYQGVVYYFSMKQDEEIMVDWYPCRRKVDGVVGFWDCVTQTFIEPIV